MCAAVALTLENAFGISKFFFCDHFNSHWHRPLTFKATDNLREINHFGDIGIFSWYFSHEFAHRSLLALCLDVSAGDVFCANLLNFRPKW